MLFLNGVCFKHTLLRFWLSLLLVALTVSSASAQTPLQERYTQLQQEANRLFNQGELSQAIERFEQALQLAPKANQAAATNNLAATYLRRAKYHTQAQKNDKDALPDYQMAVFWLAYGWPEGVEKKPLHTENTAIAKDQLQQVYRRLGLPNQVAPHLNAGRAFREQGLFRNAIVCYQQVLSLEPENAEARLALGDMYTVLNRPDKAAYFYKDLAENKTPSALQEQQDAALRLANTLQKQGQLEQAVEVLNQALEKNPGNQPALSMLERLWRDEVSQNPNNAIAHANLARVFQQQQRYDLAQKAYDIAERLLQHQGQPLDVKTQVRMNRGSFYEATQQWPLAEQAYQSVLDSDPGNADALERLSAIYKQNNNPVAAINVYRKALKPGQEQKQVALHVTLLKEIAALPTQTEQEQALQAYAAGHPNSALVAAAVGERFHQWKQYEQAVMYYQRAVTLEPKDSTTWANLGLALQAKGDSEKALDALLQARTLDPNNKGINEQAKEALTQEAYRLYTVATATLDKAEKPDAKATEQALLQLERAANMEPSNDTYRLGLAIRLQQAGQLAKALIAYNRVLQLKPTDGLVAYYRGTAYQQQGNVTAARADYQKALALTPTLKEAKEAIALLNTQQGEQQLLKAQQAFDAKQYVQAITLLNPITQPGSQNSVAFYYKGLSLNAIKRYKEAVTAFEQALKLDATLFEATYALALAYDEQRLNTPAKANYQKFLNQMKNADATTQQEQQPYVEYAAERVKAL